MAKKIADLKKKKFLYELLHFSEQALGNISIK